MDTNCNGIVGVRRYPLFELNKCVWVRKQDCLPRRFVDSAFTQRNNRKIRPLEACCMARQRVSLLFRYQSTVVARYLRAKYSFLGPSASLLLSPHCYVSSNVSHVLVMGLPVQRIGSSHQPADPW